MKTAVLNEIAPDTTMRYTQREIELTLIWTHSLVWVMVVRRSYSYRSMHHRAHFHVIVTSHRNL